MVSILTFFTKLDLFWWFQICLVVKLNSYWWFQICWAYQLGFSLLLSLVISNFIPIDYLLMMTIFGCDSSNCLFAGGYGWMDGRMDSYGWFQFWLSRQVRFILMISNWLSHQVGYILMISNLLHSSSWNYSDVSLVISNFTPHQIGYALVITMFYVDYSNSFLLMTMDALMKLDEW